LSVNMENRRRIGHRGNGTTPLLVVSALLLLLALAAFSLLFNALRTHRVPLDTNAPAEQFAPGHRPYVAPPPDQEAQPKQGILLQFERVEWQAI
jgi:hypothetical protein